MKIYITILLTALTSAFTRISMFQTRSFLKTRSQLKSIEPFKNNSFVKLRSHFTILSTRVTDINILKKTLLDINKNFDLYQGPLLINGYNNKMIEVDLSIKQDNYYDIGFILENDVYNLVTDLDFWNQTVSPTEFMDNLIKNVIFLIFKS